MASEFHKAEHQEETLVDNRTAGTNRSSDGLWGLSSSLDLASKWVFSKKAFHASQGIRPGLAERKEKVRRLLSRRYTVHTVVQPR